MRYTIEELDAMEGRMFEYAVADLMFHNGFRNVRKIFGSSNKVVYNALQ
jgi:hypothetical protein